VWARQIKLRSATNEGAAVQPCGQVRVELRIPSQPRIISGSDVSLGKRRRETKVRACASQHQIRSGRGRLQRDRQRHIVADHGEYLPMLKSLRLIWVVAFAPIPSFFIMFWPCLNEVTVRVTGFVTPLSVRLPRCSPDYRRRIDRGGFERRRAEVRVSGNRRPECAR